MSQHDFNIANQSFPATRTDLNNALTALASNSSGATAPTTTYANQFWYDTSTNILYIRNEANNGWVSVITLDASMTATASELNQLDAITRGSILYGNSSGATARLAKGGAGTVLTSDGTDISWDAVAAGGGTAFISSTDISNAATFAFTGFDASKYDVYKLFFTNITPQTDVASLLMLSSSNGGSSYDSGSNDYSFANFFMQSSYGQFTGGLANQSSMNVTGQLGTASGEEGGASIEITIFGPHLAQYTQFQTRCYAINNGALPFQHMSGFNRVSAADVDAVRFAFDTGNIVSGTFTAYGYKNS